MYALQSLVYAPCTVVYPTGHAVYASRCASFSSLLHHGVQLLTPSWKIPTSGFSISGFRDFLISGFHHFWDFGFGVISPTPCLRFGVVVLRAAGYSALYVLHYTTRGRTLYCPAVLCPAPLVCCVPLHRDVVMSPLGLLIPHDLLTTRSRSQRF